MKTITFLISVTLFFAGTANAESVSSLIRKLSDSKRADATVTSIVAKGPSAIAPLVTTAKGSSDVAVRGWAVLAISRIPGREADTALLKLQEDGGATELVRTWAAAGRVSRAKTAEQLFELAPLKSRFPALERPLKMAFTDVLTRGGTTDIAGLIKTTSQMPDLTPVLMGPIMAAGPKKLAQVLVTARDDGIRRQAAAFLGTMAQQGKANEVARATVDVYRYRSGAQKIPWEGGALFIPGIAWPRKEALALVTELMDWMLYCDSRGMSAEHRQLHNNLRSVNLVRVVGYQSPGWNEIDAIAWLQLWKRFIGASQMRRMLERHGADRNPRYRVLQ